MEKIHLINDEGDKKEVSYQELNELNKESGYYHDIDWYLNNGYSLVDDVIKEFKERISNSETSL